MDFTKPLQFMLKGAGGGLVVSFGSSSTHGVMDVASVDAFDRGQGSVKAKLRTLLIQTGSLEGLAFNSVIDVGGTEYEVIDWAFEDEGALQRLTLRDT